MGTFATGSYALASAVDIRKGFEGLWALATQELGREVLGGDLFLFVGRDRMHRKYGSARTESACAYLVQVGLYAPSDWWPHGGGDLQHRRTVQNPRSHPNRNRTSVRLLRLRLLSMGKWDVPSRSNAA